MTVLRIPSSLRARCGGQATVALEAESLEEALRELAARYPRCAERVLDPSGHPREWVRILRDGDAWAIVPAVAGG